MTTADMAALAEAIEVMDRLRSACPWDAQQTHISLVPYAIEEAYEVAEAAEAGDPGDLADELGDLLLQVLFHARIAQETGDFTLARIASGLSEKMRRRHPHVFADVEAATAEQVSTNWDAIKIAETGRTHPLDGIGPLPALMRAQKVVSRARRAGLPVTGLPTPATPTGPDPRDNGISTELGIGAELFATVARAHEAGVDAEQALRAATRAVEEHLRAGSPAARAVSPPTDSSPTHRSAPRANR